MLQPISSSDLYRMRWITGAQISPDGNRIAYVVREVDSNCQYRSNLWMALLDQQQTVRLTTGSFADSDPCWSPDGEMLAFSRNDALCLSDPASGDWKELCKLPGLTDPIWSPTGDAIAFTALTEEEEIAVRDAAGTPMYWKISRLHYKSDGTGFWDGTCRQVFVFDLESGQTHQITSGPHNHLTPCWSPDGEHLAFSANRSGDHDRTRIRDIWRVPIAQPADPVRLTSGLGPASHPSWSPSGTHIVYYSHDNRHAAATYPSVWAVAASGGDEYDLLTGFDRPVEDSILDDMNAPVSRAPQWSDDGRSIYFLATDGHSTHVYRAAGDGGQPEPVIVGNRRIFDFSFDGDSRTAFVASEWENICDLYMSSNGRETRLTHINGSLLDNRAPGDVRHFTYEGAGGREVDAWVMLPPHHQAGDRLPMVVQINRGRFGESFFHEFHVLAGSGICVLCSNIAGAYAYGQSVKNLTHYEPGELDFADVMTSVKTACRIAPIDPDRLGILGGSYGGWMTNWALTRTNRFKVAVSQRSVSNKHSHWGTGDINYFRWGKIARPWDNPETLLELSPLQYADRINTPLLLIHSDEDHRCPIEQSEQMFTALKYQNKEVEMIVFHEESHDLSRSGQPMKRVARLDVIRDWLTKHLT